MKAVALPFDHQDALLGSVQRIDPPPYSITNEVCGSSELHRQVVNDINRPTELFGMFVVVVDPMLLVLGYKHQSPKLLLGPELANHG